MDKVRQYLDEIDNREIWCCDFFATRINLQEPFLSLCHDAYVGQCIVGELDGYTPEKYYERMLQLAKQNEDADSHCRRCEKCKRQKFILRKLSWVTINTSWFCNSSCIYCAGHYASEYDGREVLSVIKKFHKDKLFEKECLFDWGGGEPTLNPIFETTSMWLTQHGYRQRINTNGIVFSEATAYALMTDLAVLRLSLDSGTEECFRKVKGNEHYDLVWGNIEKYRKINSEIYLKYNVFNYNSELSEIDAFLDNCERVKINHIIIDGEVTSYQPQSNAGPFYYTEKEFIAMHYLEDEAKRRGFNVYISDYAFSYRAEYDMHGRLILPSKYIDNLDYTIVSNGIKVNTEPSVKALIGTLKNTKKKIILRGYGNEGKMLHRILDSAGIGLAYIVDREGDALNESKGIPTRYPQEFLEESDECIVLLAGKYWKEMLKEINDFNKTNFEVMYMMGYYYQKYIELEGIE